MTAIHEPFPRFRPSVENGYRASLPRTLTWSGGPSTEDGAFSELLNAIGLRQARRCSRNLRALMSRLLGIGSSARLAGNTSEHGHGVDLYLMDLFQGSEYFLPSISDVHDDITNCLRSPHRERS